MKLPNKAKIGPYTYQLKEVDNLRADDGGDLYGHCLHHEHAILINNNMKPDRKPVIVMHECFHALFEVAGIQTKDEEQIILSLSPALIDFLKRNPKVVEYLIA